MNDFCVNCGGLADVMWYEVIPQSSLMVIEWCCQTCGWSWYEDMSKSEMEEWSG